MEISKTQQENLNELIFVMEKFGQSKVPVTDSNFVSEDGEEDPYNCDSVMVSEAQNLGVMCFDSQVTVNYHLDERLIDALCKGLSRRKFEELILSNAEKVATSYWWDVVSYDPVQFNSEISEPMVSKMRHRVIEDGDHSALLEFLEWADWDYAISWIFERFFSDFDELRCIDPSSLRFLLEHSDPTYRKLIGNEVCGQNDVVGAAA